MAYMLLIKLFLLQLLLLHLHNKIAAEVPAIIVFGDSTVDAGNNNHIPTPLRSNFKPYGRDFFGGIPTGRFSNGRLATDFYSEAFGLGPIIPAYLSPLHNIEDFATGVCFASAGTGLDMATSRVMSVIPLWQEVEYYKEYIQKLTIYLGAEKAMHIVKEAVYIISIGTNDYIENYFSPSTDRSKQFTVDEYEDFLVGIARNFIIDIYRLGARKISYTGLTAMGCVPLERSQNLNLGGACVESYNTVARDYNRKVQAMTEELSAILPGINLKYTPVYDAFVHVIENPALYGFENVDKGCCATGMFELGLLCNQLSPGTCIDANKYAFWDAVHPSEKMGRILASYVFNTTLSQFL